MIVREKQNGGGGAHKLRQGKLLESLTLQELIHCCWLHQHFVIDCRKKRNFPFYSETEDLLPKINCCHQKWFDVECYYRLYATTSNGSFVFYIFVLFIIYLDNRPCVPFNWWVNPSHIGYTWDTRCTTIHKQHNMSTTLWWKFPESVLQPGIIAMSGSYSRIYQAKELIISNQFWLFSLTRYTIIYVHYSLQFWTLCPKSELLESSVKLSPGCCTDKL